MLRRLQNPYVGERETINDRLIAEPMAFIYQDDPEYLDPKDEEMGDDALSRVEDDDGKDHKNEYETEKEETKEHLSNRIHVKRVDLFCGPAFILCILPELFPDRKRRTGRLVLQLAFCLLSLTP